MKTFYAHIRNHNSDGTVAGNGGVTIAYQVDDNIITYAIAKCHDKDRYSKYLGRIKAEGRLNSKNHAMMFDGTKREFLDTIYEYFGV